MGARWLIDGYVRELGRLLPVGPLARRRVLAEARAHLDDLADEAEAGGLDQRAAQLSAVDRFGEPDAVAASFGVGRRRSPVRLSRPRAVAAVLVAGATAAAIALALSLPDEPPTPGAAAAGRIDEAGRVVEPPAERPPPVGTSTLAPSARSRGTMPAASGSPPSPPAAVLVSDRPPVVALATPLSQSVAVTRRGRTVLVPRHAAIRLLDPGRFPELRGRRVQLRGPGAGNGAYALSPDGRGFAVAADVGGLGVELVDLSGMRNLGTIPLGIVGEQAERGRRTWIRTVSWPRPDRVLVIVQTNLPPYASRIGLRRIMVVDPLAGRVVRRVDLRVRGIVGRAVPVGEQTLLLVTRGERRSVVVIDPEGRWSTRPLPRSLARPATWPEPAVQGGRALVPVPGRAELVAISADLEIETIELRGETSALVDQAWSIAGFLPTGELVAVAPSEGGVLLIDPANWTARVLDAGATGASVAGDLVLTFVRPGGPGEAVDARGITAFDALGSVRYRALTEQDVASVQVAGPYVHVVVLAAGPQPWTTVGVLLDAATGDELAPLPGNGVGARNPVQLTLLEGTGEA